MAINVIQFPVGTFGFAGSVPVDLAYRITGGSCFDRQKVREAIPQSGTRIAKLLAERLGVKMETKTFETRSEAYDVAAAYVEAHGLEGIKIYS